MKNVFLSVYGCCEISIFSRMDRAPFEGSDVDHPLFASNRSCALHLHQMHEYAQLAESVPVTMAKFSW